MCRLTKQIVRVLPLLIPVLRPFRIAPTVVVVFLRAMGPDRSLERLTVILVSTVPFLFVVDRVR